MLFWAVRSEHETVGRRGRFQRGAGTVNVVGPQVAEDQLSDGLDRRVLRLLDLRGWGDRLFLIGRALLKVFPVDGGILRNSLGDLEMRRVLKGRGTQSIAVKRENLRAGKRQQNWRMSRDDELRLAGRHQRGHVRQERQLTLRRER